MLLAAVWPALPSVQLMLAVAGDTVGVMLEQPLRVKDGGVGFTTRLTLVVPAVPVGVGVAVSVPL